MTSSFPNNPLPDISAYHYAESEPNLAESINERIDQSVDDYRTFFARQGEINKEYLRLKDVSPLLLELTKTGFEVAKYAKELKEADKYKKDKLSEDSPWFEGYNKFTKEELAEKAKENEENDTKLIESLKQAAEETGNPDLYNAGIALSDNPSKRELVEFAEQLTEYYSPALRETELLGADNKEQFTKTFNDLTGPIRHLLYTKGVSDYEIEDIVIPSVIDLYNTLQSEWNQKNSLNLAEKATEVKKSYVYDNVLKNRKDPNAAGKVVVDYVNRFKAEFENRGDAFSEALSIVHEGILNGKLPPGTGREVLNYVQKWADGSETSLQVQRPKETGPILNAIKELETQQYEFKQDYKEKLTTQWVKDNVASIPLGEVTLEKAREVYAKFLTDSKSWGVTEVPEQVKKLISTAEETEENRFDRVEMRFKKYGYITKEDTYLITDPEYLKKIKGWIDASQKKLSEDEEDQHFGYVDASIAQWLKDNNLTGDLLNEESKSRLDRQAKVAYIKIRNTILAQPGGSALSDEILIQRTLDTIKKDYKSFYDGTAVNVYDQSFQIASVNFSKDINEGSFHLNMNVPHSEAERKVLVEMAAAHGRGEEIDARFYQTGIRDPKTNRLYTKREIGKHRLVTTGFLEKGSYEPNPERKIVPGPLQDLLLGKVSPANTLNVIAASRDPHWAFKMIAPFKPNLTMEEFYGALIYNQNTQYKFNSTNNSWIMSGYVSEDLSNAYKEMTGDEEPYSQPGTMPPDLAAFQIDSKLGNWIYDTNLRSPAEPEVEQKSFVEQLQEAFPEKDVSTVGQPVTTREAIEQTGLYKAGVGTREAINNALRDDDGTLNSLGRLVERFLSGEAEQDLEDFLRSAPIGDILYTLQELMPQSLLERILDGIIKKTKNSRKTLN